MKKLLLIISIVFSFTVNGQSLSDSTAYTIKGAKLKSTPTTESHVIKTFKAGFRVKLLGYNDDYFKVVVENQVGFMHELWLKNTNEKQEFIQKTALLKLEKQNKENQISKDLTYAQLKNKYGEYKAQAILRGEYWIGMTQEMAVESLGYPSEINKSVGVWGVHEQWVYENSDKNFYLYFEDGKLTSYQN